MEESLLKLCRLSIALRTASKQGRMTIRLAAVMPMSISTMAIVRPTMDVFEGCQDSTEVRQGRGKKTHIEGRLQCRRQGIS